MRGRLHSKNCKCLGEMGWGRGLFSIVLFVVVAAALASEIAPPFPGGKKKTVVLSVAISVL